MSCDSDNDFKTIEAAGMFLRENYPAFRGHLLRLAVVRLSLLGLIFIALGILSTSSLVLGFICGLVFMIVFALEFYDFKAKISMVEKYQSW